ncbi:MULTISPECIES: HoxN/HupN/NixA family nickel/cobalt transporter [unclassified Burkholderia]|uniref:HoxN/HupN/NixA family nickel/cobalt transporter n=1 Tax=unclassified Burkholderia TaxID=2613784 RepID=UPI000F561A9E|nr:MULTISPECIES: HoxN/HupN/NixA family nickel/cobalt transporter [unclassified Burkholderia]RQR30190.1 HoxN/HupN/NixA family nickel/cobalt transporter [Burkholderia sp. Bp9142]RQR50075.1 HoxN/HupN/NixA family nickel/cobalt transporter [Burkholderia sp. Bp9140]
MNNVIDALSLSFQGPLRPKIFRLYVLLIAFNAVTWIWALIVFRTHPLLMGSCLLAWSLGLRHAVDADHIAAIDNVTRKLMQTGQRPITIGLMFSLGHSTVVVIASVAIAVTALAMKGHMDAIRAVGGLIGTLVSTLFLFAIAVINLFALKAIVAAFRRMRHGEPYIEAEVDRLLAGRGFLSRIFQPLFRIVTRSRHMYLLGFLFGLGFDTATEVGLLGISAAGAIQGMSIWSILVFPALFTAGMTLVDTTDNILMVGAYGWAFVKPVRKLYYNITITAISVMVALFVGGVEGLGLLADRLQLSGPFWQAVGSLNDNFGLVGYSIVGLFSASWLCSFAVYRWKRFDELEV